MYVSTRVATLRALRDHDPRARELLRGLSEPEHHIVASRVGLSGGRDRSFAELAQDYDVSIERIRQLFNQGMADIERRLFEKEESWT